MSYLHFSSTSAKPHQVAADACSLLLDVGQFVQQNPQQQDAIKHQFELLAQALRQQHISLRSTSLDSMAVMATEQNGAQLLISATAVADYSGSNWLSKKLLQARTNRQLQQLAFKLKNTIDIQGKSVFIWDSCSDQPHVIKNSDFKRRVRRWHWPQHLLMLFSSILVLPLAICCIPLFKGRSKTRDLRAAIGIGVNLDKGNEQQNLVEELGVKHLIIRVYMRDIENLAAYVEFANSFNPQGDKSFLIVIVQEREHIENPHLSAEIFKKIFTAFADISSEFQVGTTINRLKWGFYCVEEYLAFYQQAQQVRDKGFPQLKLIGPSVIDFEYYYTVRAMFNFSNVRYDKLSALLYVDRRGGPANKQYLFFDTKNKIRLLYALGKLSTKVKHKQIYITEVNWPIENTAPYSPTSEKECVSLEDYCTHMLEYIETAIATNMVERVYWHQLIAPGYGLVDNREGKLIKYPQFYAFKKMLAQSSSQDQANS